MPRRKFIDKKTAVNYRLVHRSQNDPRIHDEDAPQMVFAETAAANVRDDEAARPSGASAASSASKIKSRNDLEREYGAVRRNEGEAANYGIFFDDTQYDYMQHMRELGGGDFVEAGGKKKEKFDLANALANMDVGSEASTASSVSDVFGEDMAPSEFVRKTTYQDQQNTPDAIAGFQPDMDPRLREVLEALDDEAYVDDDEDVFGELAQDGFELNQREWGEVEDEGWETDDTIKAPHDDSDPEPRSELAPGELPAPDEVPAAADAADMAYLEEFRKFKADAKAKAVPSEIPSFVTGASALTSGGRRKKRKGAKTSTSGYSMSSSALHRTEGLTLLDERFDKIEEEYAEDYFPDDMSMASGMTGMTGMSKMSSMSGVSDCPPLRSDFDSIMDDFLGNHSVVGKTGRHVRKGKVATGMEQLDEVRRGLGGARVSTRVQERNKR